VPITDRPDYRRDVTATPGDGRTFQVVAWLADRRLVLYVPEIEAATSVVGMPEADAAARTLIAELTGLDEADIRCEIRVGRAPGSVDRLPRT
jgi:hypothetical protein